MNTAEFWRSPEVPYGLVQWTVSLTKEIKTVKMVREISNPASEITEAMELVATGGAQTELDKLRRRVHTII
ncbi:MAG: hypothetical protein R3C11_09485 [Planctomycetaceae bacterium]